MSRKNVTTPSGERSSTPPADDSPTPEDLPPVEERLDESGGVDLDPSEPGPVDGLTPTEQVASSIGGTDNYAYLDQTRTPPHEGALPMDSTTEATQAELNPAFTAKKEDGGPVNANGDGIGTAPNANDLALAAAENSGTEGAVEQVQEAIDKGQEQQMDVEKVQAQADAQAEARLAAQLHPGASQIDESTPVAAADKQ